MSVNLSKFEFSSKQHSTSDEIMEPFSKKKYQDKVESIFTRFPSVQNVPFKDAYKPGLENMLRFEEILGDPHKKLRTIHVAGTNGKGSVANMIASALSACGLRTGLYTSPHLVDFRERMRIAGPGAVELVPEEYVYDFLCRYEADMDALSLSFFEITTGMAFKWFADKENMSMAASAVRRFFHWYLPRRSIFLRISSV